MADTSGIDRDMQISKDIAEFLNKVGEFNAICIVVPATVNRGTTEEKYLIEQVKSVIPKSAIDRIFLVVTNTTRVTQNVRDFAESFGLPTNNVFAFDHFAMSREGHGIFSDDDGVADEVEMKWNQGQRSFDRLMVKAKSLGKYSTKEIASISEIKAKTMEKIFDAQRKIDAIEKQRERVQESEIAYQKAADAVKYAVSSAESAKATLALAKAEKEKADSLGALETIVVKDLGDADKHSTMCMHCGVFCHENCNLEYKGPHCSEHLSGCHCIKDGFCTKCPKKCPYKEHSHQKQQWVTKTYTKEKNDVKARQSSADSSFLLRSKDVDERNNDLEEKTQKNNQQQEELEKDNAALIQLNLEKEALQHEIVELYLELEKVSMGSINVHIGEYYDRCVRNEADPAKKKKLEKDRSFYIGTYQVV